MDLKDGYYFLLTTHPASDSYLYYDPSSGKAKIYSQTNLQDFLQKVGDFVFRVESTSKGAYVIYNKTYQLAVGLQGASGRTIAMRPLDRNDKRQWWKFKDTGPSSLVNDQQKGVEIALQVTSGNVAGGSFRPGSPQQQWDFRPISDTSGSDDGSDNNEIKENRNWLRDMLRYYTSYIPTAYNVIGTYPYERSHITHPNSELRKGIQWQNSWALTRRS